MIKNCIILCVFMALSSELYAQRVGIGGQIGDPSGISLRFQNGSALGYDILAAWDLDDYFFVNVHGLWEHSLSEAPRIHYFYGPGAFLGLRDNGRNDNDDDIYLGVSGALGLNLYIQRLEIYAQVNPRISVVPGTDGDIGGGIGVRFYFK
jgi:hypothetical protein